MAKTRRATSPICLYLCVAFFILIRPWTWGNSTGRVDPVEANVPQMVIYTNVLVCSYPIDANVFQRLSKRNGFSFQYQQLQEPEPQAMALEDNMYDDLKTILNLPKRSLYIQQSFFLNFLHYGYQQPTYISIIQDPVSRFIASYYLNHVDEKESLGINECVLQRRSKCYSDYVTTVRHFCGRDQRCSSTNTHRVIFLAKRNFINEYLFVGIFEEFENTLRILENILPSYFESSFPIWNSIKPNSLNELAPSIKEVVLAEVKEILKLRLWADYEVYDFIKQEFDHTKMYFGIE